MNIKDSEIKEVLTLMLNDSDLRKKFSKQFRIMIEEAAKEVDSDTIGILQKLVQVPIVGTDTKSIIMTESEEWSNTKLALLNAVLDTLVPGARLTGRVNQIEGKLEWMQEDPLFIQYVNSETRPRELVQSLRDLADSIENLAEADEKVQST